MAIPTKSEVMSFSPINLGGKEELPLYKRMPYTQIKKLMSSGLILAISGLRRVGKTTLIKQLLGENSYYFSFDEKRYANPDALKRVIEIFLEESEKPTIALDEVFRVEDWAGILKKYHDQKLAKFIVSGSSSLLIKKGVESLSGRMTEFYVPPLSFIEFLEMKGKKTSTFSLRDVFKSKDKFEEESLEFLVKGSFPEIVDMEEKLAIDYIRKSTIEKIVFDDIPMTYRIEYVSKLYDLLKLCAINSSHLFSEVNFAEALQISRHAVSDYLFYLRKAYLIDIITPIGSHQKSLKKQKKVFVKTASIYNALAEHPNIGQLAETAVFDKLGSESLYFYRDAQKKELDFIKEIPIEVKFQSTITREDTSILLYYLEKAKKETGIVVTKDLLDERNINGKKILFIPLHRFLCMDTNTLQKDSEHKVRR